MKGADQAFAVALAAAILSMPTTTQAGGFGVLAQSGSALGNAFAGGAAAAEDATTVWYNPAGMGRLKGLHVTGVVNLIKPSFRFTDKGSTGAFAFPGTGEGGDGGGLAAVPQGYMVSDLGQDALRVGIGFNSPFGLKTEYDAGWRGQFTALTSEAKSYNLNPSVAYRLAPSIWVGAGVSVQRFSTELTNFAGPLGTAQLKAHDTAWGFNLGALFDVSDDTRIGIAYRSRIHFKPTGMARFSAGAGASDSGASTDLTVPESVSINAVTLLSPEWELMGGATWTRWSRLQALTVNRTSASPLGGAGTVITILPFDWRNTVMLAAGANYRVNDAWKLRFGIAHDPAVSNDGSRTPRLPDQSRTLLAIGAQLTPTDRWQKWTFDVAVGHEFVKDARVSNVVPAVPGALVGRFRNAANVITFQANYRL